MKIEDGHEFLLLYPKTVAVELFSEIPSFVLMSYESCFMEMANMIIIEKLFNPEKVAS